MNLVQTLNATVVGQPGAALSPYQPPANPYGGPSPAAAYGQPALFQAPAGRNGIRRKSDEGNLHLSGYGPGTTEAEIIAAFAPYVQVDEVVMKGTFSFVNTSKDEFLWRLQLLKYIRITHFIHSNVVSFQVIQ
jgi:hypothetical protein